MSNSGTNRHKIESGASEGARRATEPSPDSAAGGAGRWSSQRKVSVVLELLRGADAEGLSRKHRITMATLTEWKERFLSGAESGLKTREAEPENEDNRRLKSVVANLSVENELLREKIARMENGRPFVSWKSKK